MKTACFISGKLGVLKVSIYYKEFPRATVCTTPTHYCGLSKFTFACGEMAQTEDRNFIA